LRWQGQSDQKSQFASCRGLEHVIVDWYSMEKV